VSLRVVLSALAAAILAYASNWLTRGLMGRSTVVFVAPGLEESFKTTAALVAGAPVLPTHIAFGLVEALHDLRASNAAAAGGGPRAGEGPVPNRAGAALASVLGHALFGAVTVTAQEVSGSWPIGVGAAYLLHVGWNALVTARVGRSR